MFENGRKTIGMFGCRASEYFQRTVCKAMAEQCERWGYNLIIFSTFGAYDSNEEYITGECTMLEIPYYEKLDVIVLLLDTFDIPEQEEGLLYRLKEKVSCPVISIRKKQEGCINILSDDKKAVSQMVSHLIDCHRARRIYYLSGPTSKYDILCREMAFRETMQQRGMDFQESYIYQGSLWYDVGKRAVDYFLSLSEELPDAIVCANDYMAISVCEELNKRNINVPEDIMITGFDDVWEAQKRYPPITTVGVKPEDFAAKAMEVILSYHRGEKLAKEYLIHSENQYRASCGCETIGKELVPMFQQLLEDNQKLIHLGKQNTFMVFRMEHITQFEELPDLIGKFVEGNEGVLNFFISLNENEQFENARETGKPFTDKMSLAFYAHFNEAHTIEVEMPQLLFDRGKLLPEKFQKDSPQIYYAHSMHYREHCFGYALISLENNQFQECGNFYQSFLVNISSVLENIWIYKHIEQLNDEKHHLIRYEYETNILNQYGFLETLTKWWQEGYDKEKVLSFLCIKLPNLSEIMEVYGWKESNMALLSAIEAIRKVVEGYEYKIGRMGENEFGLIFKHGSKEVIRQLESRLASAMLQMNLEWDKEYIVEFSSGGIVQNLKEVFGIEECMNRVRLKMHYNSSVRKKSTKYIYEAVQFIRRNYHQNLSVQEIADSVGITQTYLSTCFKDVCSFSVMEYVTEYRMRKAKEMLLDTELKIKEIAYYTGYQDELYFSKVFRKRFGLSPREFRKQH